MPAPVARRESTAYRFTPVKGLPEPAADIPVHFMNGEIALACRKPGGAMRLKTSVPGNVTCPKCLKLMNLPAHPKQMSCGATTLSAESAQVREQTDHHHASSSFAGSPVSVYAGAGLFMMGGE